MENNLPLVAGVIGWPVEHSLSPAIHQAAARAVGVELTYTAIAVEAGKTQQAIADMRQQSIRGFSVTMPHKEAVIAYLDEITPSAEVLGAVNHITNTNGHLVGNNTDGDGFVLGLHHSAGVTVAGLSIGVLGSGGAARAIIDACYRHDAREVVVVARSQERGSRAAGLAHDRGRRGDASALGGCDVVVNATPVGMADTETAGEMPIDVDVLAQSATVVDIVYNPIETPLLRACNDRGITTVGGLSMLVGQAAEQFTAWTGVQAPLDAMFEVVKERR